MVQPDNFDLLAEHLVIDFDSMVHYYLYWVAVAVSQSLLMGERMKVQKFVEWKQKVVAVVVVAAEAAVEELVVDRMALDPVDFAVAAVLAVEDSWKSLDKNHFVVELYL